MLGLDLLVDTKDSGIAIGAKPNVVQPCPDEVLPNRAISPIRLSARHTLSLDRICQ